MGLKMLAGKKLKLPYQAKEFRLYLLTGQDFTKRCHTEHCFGMLKDILRVSIGKTGFYNAGLLMNLQYAFSTPKC